MYAAGCYGDSDSEFNNTMLQPQRRVHINGKSTVKKSDWSAFTIMVQVCTFSVTVLGAKYM